MRDKFVLQHRGKRYRVERGQPRSSAAQGGGAPSGSDRWYISLNLAAITSLPAEPGETEAGLRARIREWLDANPRVQESDEIFLGGG
jgi:hypothetical protein